MLKNAPFYLTAGSNAPACLMLHGLGGGIYEMQLLAEHLHQQGFTVEGANYPGHDRPTPTMPTSTWQQWYAHVLERYQRLKQQHSTVYVVGFSTGCILGLHLAATQATEQAVDKLVLMSPYFAIRHEWYYILRPEAYLFSIGKWITNVPRRRLPIRDRAMLQQAEAAAFFMTFNLAAVRSANELIAQVKTEVPQITVPSLILQSPKDSVVDPAGAQWLVEHLGARDNQLIWLTQSDHAIALDSERSVVFQAVTQFLQPS